MVIKKIHGGWEYRSIVCENKEDLIASIEAELAADPSASADAEETDDKLIVTWEPGMDETSLGYFLAQYLLQPGANPQARIRGAFWLQNR